MSGTGKLYAVLMIVIMAIIVSSVLESNQDTVTQQIYAFDSHDVTLLNGSTVTTPDPMISPDLQAQIWSLAPIGVWLGCGLAIFLLFFGGRRR